MARLISTKFFELNDAYSKANKLSIQMDIIFEKRIWWTLWIKKRRFGETYIKCDREIYNAYNQRMGAHFWIKVSTGEQITHVGRIGKLNQYLISARLSEIILLRSVHNS